MAEQPVAQKMKEILAKRDKIRRESQQRVEQGLEPFPTVEEVEARSNRQPVNFQIWDDDRDARRWG